MEDTYLLTTRCPVFRRRDSHLGFRTELETLAGHAKGKGPSGGPARPKVPMGQPGADRPIVVMKRGNARGAKGLCQEDAQASCCTGDEGGPFEVAL